MWLCGVMFGLAGLSGALAWWQWRLARTFRFATPGAPPPAPAFHPPLTLLKPLRGADEATERCLRSWLTQDYPAPVEVLFGVGDAQDPVCPLVERLIREHPHRLSRLIVCPPDGPNGKASTLAHLEALARHEVLVISDADVFVPREFLARVIEPLQDPQVVLVNCFYRLAASATAAQRWEAVAINADFWTHVLQARRLRPLDFALGAAMALRRADLARAGGYRAVQAYLADDFQIGRRLAAPGARIELSPVVVECHEPARGWAAVWAHQLRWVRTMRVCRPAGYLLSILGNVTLWSLGAAAALGTRAGEPGPHARWAGSGAVLALLLWRCWTAQANHRRLSPATADWRWAWMVWLKDLLHAMLWVAAFTGNRVLWSGRAYRVSRDGRLRPEAQTA